MGLTDRASFLVIGGLIFGVWVIPSAAQLFLPTGAASKSGQFDFYAYYRCLKMDLPIPAFPCSPGNRCQLGYTCEPSLNLCCPPVNAATIMFSEMMPT